MLKEGVYYLHSDYVKRRSILLIEGVHYLFNNYADRRSILPV